jgi:hypothetical protein
MIEDTRPRYKCACPGCGHEFTACKSIAQELGLLNSGIGSCPKCESFYRLSVDEATKSMILTPFEDFTKEHMGESGIHEN